MTEIGDAQLDEYIRRHDGEALRKLESTIDIDKRLAEVIERVGVTRYSIKDSSGEEVIITASCPHRPERKDWELTFGFPEGELCLVNARKKNVALKQFDELLDVLKKMREEMANMPE